MAVYYFDSNNPSNTVFPENVHEHFYGEGGLVETYGYFGEKFAFYTDDDTGEIVLVIWKNTKGNLEFHPYHEEDYCTEFEHYEVETLPETMTKIINWVMT